MEIECGSSPIRKFFIPSDYDNDLIADCVDPDDDNDGCLDEEDLWPYDENACADADGDGIADYYDYDSDNDDFTDSDEVNEYGTDPSDPSSYPTWNVTININGDGTVDPSTGAYKRGTNITFTATEGTGYLLTGWYGDLLSDPVTRTLSTNIVLSTNLNVIATFSDDADGDSLSNTLENQLGSNPWQLDSDGDGIDDPTEVSMTNMVFTFDPTVNSGDEMNRLQNALDQIPGVMGDTMMELRGGEVSITIDSNTATIEIPVEASMDNFTNWINMDSITITRPTTNDVEFFELEFD